MPHKAGGEARSSEMQHGRALFIGTNVQRGMRNVAEGEMGGTSIASSSEGAALPPHGHGEPWAPSSRDAVGILVLLELGDALNAAGTNCGAAWG